MKQEIDLEPIPPKKPGINSYRPGDIKRWGVQRFLDAQAEQGPFQVPDLHFTAAENQLMDELIEQERQAATDGL